MPHPEPARDRLHAHDFELADAAAGRRAWIVAGLTSAMMIGEIAVGIWSGSMALLADGWHMATHAAALGVTGIAYALARRHRSDPRYAFGTWKIEILGGFASSVALGIVAIYVVAESVLRLFSPGGIRYDEALAVAALGLVVNVVCAALLQLSGRPGPVRHDHGGSGHHHDLNLRAAYLHVLADALTSLLAIVALLGGRFLRWHLLDPAMGILGAALIARWAIGLARDASRILLDREMSLPLVDRVRTELESDGDTRVADLHVWRVGRRQFACVTTVVTGSARSALEYHRRLSAHENLAHLTVEVLRREEATLAPA